MRLANALQALGVGQGDRIGTLAWNGYRHFELYYAVSGMGAVLHTINPRLFAEQIVYIANHAEDRYIFADLTFVALLEQLAPELEGVAGIVVMTDEAHMPETNLANVHCYETLLAGGAESFDWPALDENAASSLCYTSGTTGNPKGVLYSHRSTVLHTYAACMRDVIGLGADDVVMPVVPMFHANSWGIAYAAPMSGAKLVLPGPRMDGASIHELMRGERVTVSAGVPTVWLMLLQYLRESGESLPDFKRCVIGGSAAPRSMIEAFETEYDTTVLHAWGMTEMSPLGVVGTMTPELLQLPYERQLDYKEKQGRGVYGVEMKIIDDDGNELPRDGEAFGHLMARGPWIAKSYFKGEGGEILDGEDWFDTGDVATLDPLGFMHITDRAKDVIKSGGEWISSDRPGEPGGRPSGRRRGGGDRRAAPEMGRAAAADRGPRRWSRARGRRPAEVHGRQNRQVVDAGRRRLRRGDPAYRDRQDPEGAPARAIQGPPAADRRRGAIAAVDGWSVAGGHLGAGKSEMPLKFSQNSTRLPTGASDGGHCRKGEGTPD